MNRSKSIIITSIIGTFFIAMFVIQPISTQANNNAIPGATPEKNRKVPSKPLHSPVKGKTMGLELRQRRPNQTQYNPKEIAIDKVKGKQPSSVTNLGRENSIELASVKGKTPTKGLYSANPGGGLSERRKQRRRGNNH